MNPSFFFLTAEHPAKSLEERWLKNKNDNLKKLSEMFGNDFNKTDQQQAVLLEGPGGRGSRWTLCGTGMYCKG